MSAEFLDPVSSGKNEAKIETKVTSRHSSTKKRRSFDNLENCFFVSKYQKNIEEEDKINRIFTVRRTKWRVFVTVVLYVITVGLMHFVFEWFPKLRLLIEFSTVNIMKATHIALYTQDNELEIKNLKKILLPVIDIDHSIIKNFNMNIEGPEVILFEHRELEYVFNKSIKTFEALNFGVKITQDKFMQKIALGLSEEEVEYQQKLFDECYIDLSDDYNIFNIFQEEVVDPFYLFTLFTIILSFCTGYVCYSCKIYR